MTSLLIVLACTNFAATTPPVAAKDSPNTEPMATRPVAPKPVVLPTTALVQESCFVNRYEESRSRNSYNPPPPTKSAARPASSPAPAMSQPMSTGSSSGLGASGQGSGGGGADGRVAGNTRAAESLAPDAAARGGPSAVTTPSAEPNMAPQDAAAAAPKATSSKDMPLADKSNKAEAEYKELAKRKGDEADADDEMSTLAREKKPVEPDADWGATVYLSNDDSMSLASAQRLLWAVQNRGPVKTSEIRPHELLNYFSFDTAEIKPNQVFSTLGAAQQTGPETLTVSFAVKGYTPARKPLDLTVVLDRSGSMAADGRMEYLKRGLMKMTESLQPGDRMDMVLFDHEVCSPLQNFVVGRDDMGLLTSTISQLAPRGSTNLGIGLGKGYALATGRDVQSTGEQGRNKRMMLITDALMNEGQIDPNILSEIGRGYEQAGVNLTAIGVGRDFNDKVLDQLSEKGHGAYVYLGSEAVVDRVFGVGLDALTRTIAQDVHFSVDLPPSLAMERFYGEEASTVKADVQPINYFAGTSQLFLQDLKIKNARVVAADPIVLHAEWVNPDTGSTETQAFHTTVGALMASDTHNLAKGRALMAWSDLLMTRSLGGEVCGAPMATWRERVAILGEDAEITWLDGLTSPLCGQTPVPVQPTVRTVALKVKLDSDMPIAEVGLKCGGWSDTAKLASGVSVASFNARPGACQLTLQGNVPMTAAVQVPDTATDLRCVVRGGRLACS